MPSEHLSAEEAAAFLGVARATLYSYVSRGMLESVALEPGTRRRFYRRADLLALKHRSSFRNDPERAAAEVIEFGSPILSTSISLITEAEHSYRGRSSRELAENHTFEEVAQFLWTGPEGGRAEEDRAGRAGAERGGPARGGTAPIGAGQAGDPAGPGRSDWAGYLGEPDHSERAGGSERPGGPGRTGATLPVPHAAWREPIDPDLIATPDRLAAAGVAELSPIEKLQILLPLLEHRDLHAYGSKPAVLVPSAIRILLHLTHLSAGRPYEGSIARTLGAAWGTDPRRLDALLIVIADHELNIATFTARCAASAGANLYQSVLAGLAALQGYKHLRGQVAEAKLFFAEVLEEGDPEPVIRRYLRRGGVIPGFHNPYRRLYAGRDPRVATLFDNLAATERHELLLDTARLAEAATGEYPRIDFALACAEPLLGLPEDSIFSLIALGRTAGMIAHVFEQYASERVIRPRARYAAVE